MLVAVAFVTVSLPSGAQFALPVVNNLRPAAEKVLNASCDHFRTIRGDTLSYAENVTVFDSRVKPDGALESTLTQFSDNKNIDYSWQAIILRTDDFEAASKKYNSCYQQLKNTQLSTGSYSCKMDGSFAPAFDNRNFYSTVFHPVTDDPELGKLRLEILLESDMTQWTVSMLVYNRDHDDSEGSLTQ